MFCSYTVLYVLVESSSEMSDVEASGEKSPLLDSQTHRESGSSDGGSKARAARSLAGSCGRYCLIAASLPLLPFKRKKSDEGRFSSALAVLLTCLGSVVGTGNIWRFPRILGNHAEEGGALSFLLVWFMFLWIWSVPVVLIEYGVGRYTRKALIESWGTLLGPAYRFLGAFPVLVSFCIASYYSVLVGWCGYYFIQMCASSLPSTLDGSQQIWNDLQGSDWPVLCHGLAILLASLSVSRGVSTIEPVNKVIVPVLLSIIVVCFYWSIFLPYAGNGIIHLFSPSWESLKNSKLWIDAASQNAWDTSAGVGLFLTFSTFMKRTHGAVQLGTLTPFFNNIVSLVCGVTVFSTVFSIQMQENKPVSEIVDTLKTNGEANTGLTFIWMPVLFQHIGSGGRFLAIGFFLCLSLAGLSSLISLLELTIHSLTDFGSLIPATVAVGAASFLLGSASATDLTVLVNQDAVWGYALILCGCLLIFMVFRYGIIKFRRNLYIEYGIGDWPLPWIWVGDMFLAPCVGVAVIVWWMVEVIRTDPDWWLFSTESLAMTLSQWAGVLLVVIGLNWWLSPLSLSPPSNPLLRRIIGLFVVYHDEVDLHINETTPTPEKVAETVVTLQTIRKETTPPVETASITIKDVEL